MNKIVFLPVLGLILLISCAGGMGKMVFNPIEMPWVNQTPFTVINHKNSAAGREMPDWVGVYIDGGIGRIEALDAYEGSYAFIARNEGNNLTAMNHWLEGFSTELDFPRLAAARMEARFFSAAPLPDQEYGAYYEALVRTAADFPWTGAVRRDDFWIYKNYLPTEDEGERQAWEFMILLTVGKSVFHRQAEEVFNNVKPAARPTRDQMNAVNRVRERFFEGF